MCRTNVDTHNWLAWGNHTYSVGDGYRIDSEIGQCLFRDIIEESRKGILPSIKLQLINTVAILLAPSYSHETNYAAASFGVDFLPK